MTSPDTTEPLGARSDRQIRREADRRRAAAQRRVEAMGGDLQRDLRALRRTGTTSLITLRASLAETAASALARILDSVRRR